MLAAASRSLTKAASAKKTPVSGVKSRKYASSAPRSTKPATYSAAETQQIQAWLDKVNSDPTKQANLNKLVEASKQKHEQVKKFWSVFAPIQGVKVPAKGLQRDVLGGVALTSLQSWSEFLYALRMYQSKLQQDEAFYKLHTVDLHSKDPKVVKAAATAVFNYIKSIQTGASTAKQALFTLVRKGRYEGIRNGEAVTIATEYITRFKREVKVEITTAHKLSAQDLEHYESRFHQIANDERTKIFITTKEDPSILGGEILNINGAVYDQSWKKQQEEAINVLAQFNNNL